MIAAGRRIDPDRTPMFKSIVGEVYRNPFEVKKPELKTADEILGYLVRQMEEMIDGSAASCGQN